MKHFEHAVYPLSPGPVPHALVRKYHRPGPRYTSYPTAPCFHTAFGPSDFLAQMQRERYPRVRSLAPGTPRWLARWVRACLRAKPRQRFADAERFRRVLERRLGRPSPADCRREISTWLASSAILEPAPDETAPSETPAGANP